MGVSQAISSTNGNDIINETIWELRAPSGIRHSIECSVWQYNGDPSDLKGELTDKPVDLRPHGGRCHTFQYRLETLEGFDEDAEDDDAADQDAEDEEWALDEADEALCPYEALDHAMTKIRRSAEGAIEAWMADKIVATPSSRGEQL